jgi:pSer/pThr/pTyr-binding forkhead associated (FHA) protein
MQVILKPVSHPQWGEIVIEDNLFAIGRDEAPFQSFKSAIVAKLSRRHARLFEENGLVYIADMGSSNGTKLNNHRVHERPERVRQGDELRFAETLVYKVEIKDGHEPSHASESAAIELLLEPIKADLGIEPIVVTRFPFLISKFDDAFSRYKERIPNEVNYLSRRHAHMFIKQDDLYIEDLGSTNGTFVSGERLDEHARLLRDGDSVAFGGDQFNYKARLQKAKEEVPADEKIQAVTTIATDQKMAADGSKTTFVATATSFLDIFCVQDEASDQDELSAKQAQVIGKRSDGNLQPTMTKGAGSAAKIGILHKIGTFVGEFKEAFSEDKPGNSRGLWIGMGVVGVVLAIAIGVYSTGVDDREIKRLLEQGKYMESVLIANQTLKKHPENKQAGALATEGLIKAVVPAWKAKLLAEEFAAANQILAQARAASQFNAQGLSLLEVLQWMTDLERFVVDRSGLLAPIIMFKHEDTIDHLVERWKSDKIEYQRLMSRILEYAPGFSDVESSAISHLRTLQLEQSLYLRAIKNLKRRIKQKLAAGRPREVTAELADFERKYPKVKGTQALREDLREYLQLFNAIEEKDLVTVLNLRRHLKFRTPLFKTSAENTVATALPPERVLSEYQKATEAWRKGDANQAIAILEPLTKKSWGELAIEKRQHFQKVLKDYELLKQSRGDPAYGYRVLEFYASLQPAEDTHYINAIKDDFITHKEKALADAREKYNLAFQNWQTYQKNGGISGIARVEDSISDNYRQQAQRLKMAFNQILRSHRIYQLLSLKQSIELQSLRNDILAESRRQRQWLNDLKFVLKPSLLQAKLQLLPKPQQE